jgi:putative oxidoreductase
VKALVSTRLAIIIFAVIIAFFGANNILHARNMATNVPSFLPASKMMVYISGAGFLLAAVAFIIDRYAKIAGYLLALLLLIIVFSVDVPGIVRSANVHIKMLYVTNMLKDAALAMASVLIADISRERAI